MTGSAHSQEKKPITAMAARAFQILILRGRGCAAPLRDDTAVALARCDGPRIDWTKKDWPETGPGQRENAGANRGTARALRAGR